jgi:protein SCO1/2
MKLVIPILFFLLQACTKQTLPILAKAPSFELTERSGQKVKSTAYDGKVWIAAFIFTSCEGRCPLIIEQVKKLEKNLAPPSRPHFVFFSVDPEHDKAAVLKKYAIDKKVDTSSYSFFTGDKKGIDNIALKGFFLAAGGDEAFLHSSRLVLVDKNQQIRGYYDALDDEAMENLKRDLGYISL